MYVHTYSSLTSVTHTLDDRINCMDMYAQRNANWFILTFSKWKDAHISTYWCTPTNTKDEGEIHTFIYMYMYML